MQDLIALPTALAFGAAAMTLFAITRLTVRAENAPAFLTSDVVAYGSALVLTALIAVSLIMTAMTIAPHLGSIVHAAIVAGVLHLGYWAVARLVMPVSTSTENTTLLPSAAPAV